MEISIKLMNGTLLKVSAAPTDTVAQLKANLLGMDSSLVVERQQLLYQGKILKDVQTVAELSYNAEFFIVCMLKKEKKAATSAPAPTPAVTASSAGTSGTLPGTPAATPAPTSAPAAPVAAPAPAAQNYATPEAIANLQAFSGAPEAECAAALNAAMGNADMAFTFLTEGIPDQSTMGGDMLPQPPATGTPLAAPASATGTGLEALRSHPQFNALRQTVQSNPAALPQILQVIGEQSPELLQAIHANEADFLAMMNEPVDTTAAAPPPALTPATQEAPAYPQAANPAALRQMLQGLPAEQRQAFAAQLGIPAEQLDTVMQALSQMPPEQVAQLMGGGGADGGAGGPPPGTIQLTQAEMDAVQRLESMCGCSRQAAAQAYLACDRNEDLAANMILDGGFADDEDDYA